MNKITATIAFAAACQAVNLQNGYMEPLQGWADHDDFFEADNVDNLGIFLFDELNAALDAQDGSEERVMGSLESLMAEYEASVGQHNFAIEEFIGTYVEQRVMGSLESLMAEYE